MDSGHAKRQSISRAYFARHKGYVFGGMVMGLVLVVFLNLVPHARTPTVIGWITSLVLSCPFGWRTPQGRAWWMAYLALITSIAGSIHWGLLSPVGIVCAAIAVLAGGAALCLRWNVPNAE